MPDVSIYNICCQAGRNANDIVRKAYQMTDSSVIKGWFNSEKSGHIADNQQSAVDSEKRSSSKLSHKRITFNYVCRELVWKFGRWKTKSLKQFIDEVKPDIIYLPIYSSGYMVDIQKYVIRLAKVPVVGHISDELYAYTDSWLASPFKNLYRSWIRKKIREIIKTISYGEVFAKGMASEYSQIFKRSFYVIGKGVREKDISPNSEYTVGSTVDFVFTGNYGGERGRQLVELARQMNDCCKSSIRKPRLLIYSTTHAEDEINRKLTETGCVVFKGAVYGNDLRDVQRRADFLVHVEGFEPKAIKATRYSFSTKIIDYLLAQRPIFAIGPNCVNSIKVLSENHMAIVSSNTASLRDNLERIGVDKIDTEAIIANGLKYLRTERNIDNIQAEMLERFKILVL